MVTADVAPQALDFLSISLSSFLSSLFALISRKFKSEELAMVTRPHNPKNRSFSWILSDAKSGMLFVKIQNHPNANELNHFKQLLSSREECSPQTVPI